MDGQTSLVNERGMDILSLGLMDSLPYSSRKAISRRSNTLSISIITRIAHYNMFTMFVLMSTLY